MINREKWIDRWEKEKIYESKNNSSKKPCFVCDMFPYPSGNSMHLGNLSSILPADVLARYHRLCGDDVLYVSGTDCHGTPITITAEKEKTTPEAVADKYHKEFCKGFLDDMDMSYDCYTTTTTENHKKVVSDLFLKLLEKECRDSRYQIHTKHHHHKACDTVQAHQQAR